MIRLDPYKAPDVFAVDDATLAQEMESIEVVCTVELSDHVTVISGFRRMDHTLPVTVIKTAGSDQSLHAIVLPGGSVD